MRRWEFREQPQLQNSESRFRDENSIKIFMQMQKKVSSHLQILRFIVFHYIYLPLKQFNFTCQPFFATQFFPIPCTNLQKTQTKPMKNI